MTRDIQQAPSSLSQSKSLGERLRWHRLRLGLSQEALAEAIGASARSVRRWEQDSAVPQGIFRERLGHAFGIDPWQLPGGLPHTEPEQISIPRPFWNMPFLRNPFFTGREALLEHLHQLLRSDNPTVPIRSYSLYGLGGIGKTQIAIEYVYRHAHEYAAVFWINADTTENIIASLRSIAECLDLPERLEQEQSKMSNAVISWLNNHQNWFLVVDNIEEVELVKQALPKIRQGSLLFTTRLPTLGVLAQSVEVEQMSLEEGRNFLLRRAQQLRPQTSFELDADDALLLAEAMDGLPLALDQAGAYIQETQCSIADFLQIFRNHPLHLLGERETHTDHPASVVKTFQLSFECLQRENPIAANLLTWCCFLAPDGISEELLIKGIFQNDGVFHSAVPVALQLNIVLRDLLAYSLIRRNAQMRKILLHRLVQAVLKQSMAESLQQKWTERVLRVLHQVFPIDVSDQTCWPWCEQLLPHALLAITVSKQQQWVSVELPALLLKTAQYLCLRARYGEAEPLYRYNLALREQVLEAGQPEGVNALNMLAECIWKLGRYEEAEAFFRQTLSLLAQSAEPDHLQIAVSLNGLASLLEDAGRYDEVEPLLLRALHIRERELGAEHLDVTYPLNNLAILYAHQGRYGEAEPLFLRVLSLREKLLQAAHPEIATVLNNLALLYRLQGRYQEAEAFYLRAQEKWIQTLGADHPHVATALNNLAGLYLDQERYGEAEPLSRRALQMREQSLGLSHPCVAYSTLHLAEACGKLGRCEEAEALYQRTLQMREQALGAGHPDVAMTLTSMAEFYSQQGCCQRAEEFYRRALHIWQQVLGGRHDRLAISQVGLAKLYSGQGRYVEAEALYQQALALLQETLGLEHPRSMKVVAQLRELHEAQR